jgi:hypothetical protein
LLVSKYGVISPSLRSEGCDLGDAEDDFLQVVIRYIGEFGMLDLDDDDKNTKLTATLLHHKALSSKKIAEDAVASCSSSSKNEPISANNVYDGTNIKAGLQKQQDTQFCTPPEQEKVLPNLSQIPAQRDKANRDTTRTTAPCQNALNVDSRYLK